MRREISRVSSCDGASNDPIVPQDDTLVPRGRDWSIKLLQPNSLPLQGV